MFSCHRQFSVSRCFGRTSWRNFGECSGSQLGRIRTATQTLDALFRFSASLGYRCGDAMQCTLGCFYFMEMFFQKGKRQKNVEKSRKAYFARKSHLKLAHYGRLTTQSKNDIPTPRPRARENPKQNGRTVKSRRRLPCARSMSNTSSSAAVLYALLVSEM